jgi:hypothetical protein
MRIGESAGLNTDRMETGETPVPPFCFLFFIPHLAGFTRKKSEVGEPRPDAEGGARNTWKAWFILDFYFHLMLDEKLTVMF